MNAAKGMAGDTMIDTIVDNILNMLPEGEIRNAAEGFVKDAVSKVLDKNDAMDVTALTEKLGEIGVSEDTLKNIKGLIPS